jgi:hypothetical protein
VDVCGETPAKAAGDTGAALGELAGRLGQVEEQLTEFHRRSAHRELVIDRLHEENQQLRGGFGKIILEPVVADLIRLDDQLNREVRQARTFILVIDPLSVEAFWARLPAGRRSELGPARSTAPSPDLAYQQTHQEIEAMGVPLRKTRLAVVFSRAGTSSPPRWP